MSTTTLSTAPATIGQKIAEKRHLLDMAQGDLAAKLGISQKHLCQVEKGHVKPSPSLAYRIGIELALDLDLRELLAVG